MSDFTQHGDCITHASTGDCNLCHKLAMYRVLVFVSHNELMVCEDCIGRAHAIVSIWESDNFRLELYETDGVSHYGKLRHGYRFYDGNILIFSGNEFCPSPMYASDSLDSIFALLGFLSLREGDTDSEYFDDYTPEQLAWRDSGRCEDLSYLVYEFEYQTEES